MAQADSATKVKIIIAVVALLIAGVLILQGLGFITLWGGPEAPPEDFQEPDYEQLEEAQEEALEEIEELERRGLAQPGGA